MQLIPGKNIGIVAAASIASSLTQDQLNRFHHCGSNNQSQNKGIPRLLELLNLSQKLNPTIYSFQPAKLGIIHPCLFGNDIIIKVEPRDPPHWVSWFTDKCQSSTGVEISCDEQKCVKGRVSIDVFKFFSDNNLKYVCSPKYQIYVWGDSVDVIEQETLQNFKKIQLCGIKGVIDCEPGFVFAHPNVNLYQQIMRAPMICPEKTISNNVWDIYKTLGVEASRSYLFVELYSIINSHVYPIHIELLINHMTWPGTLQSISRYSTREDSSAVFTKVSFEESMLNFLIAIFRNDEDTLQEMSSSILVGERCKVGTGYCIMIRFIK